jgi:hypothetical protein
MAYGIEHGGSVPPRDFLAKGGHAVSCGMSARKRPKCLIRQACLLAAGGTSA